VHDEALRSEGFVQNQLIPLDPSLFLLQYIHLYSHKLQLQKQEIKKTKEKETKRIKEHNVSNAN